MRNSMKTPKIALALVSAPLLAFGVAACGENTDDSSTTAEQSTVTVTESASDSATSEAQSSESSASESSESSSAAAENNSGEAPMITLGGNDVDNAAFQPVRCQEGQDDGRAQIEFEAGENNSDNELDVDIYKDDLKLDSLDLEIDRAEWEVEDADLANAEVTENNGEYTVKATVTKDDSANEKQDIEVSFKC